MSCFNNPTERERGRDTIAAAARMKMRESGGDVIHVERRGRSAGAAYLPPPPPPPPRRPALAGRERVRGAPAAPAEFSLTRAAH